jgi:hypothetical protein
MKTSIAKALFNSYSYSEYIQLVSNLILEDKVTGNEQSDDLLKYSILNETRMKRLNKTIKVEETIAVKLKKLEKHYLWLVISEGWCGDAAQLLPVFNKMALESENNIELKIILRDENEEVMQLFLTNGGKSIPKLIIIDKATGGVCGDFGPRPKGATQLINDYKEKFGTIDETLKSDLQLWYLHDKGLSTQIELLDLMNSITV